MFATYANLRTHARMHKPAYLYARTKVRNNHTTIQQHDWERQQQPFFDDGISRTRRSICEQEVAATSASHAGRRVLAGPRYRQQRLECSQHWNSIYLISSFKGMVSAYWPIDPYLSTITQFCRGQQHCSPN